MLFGLVIYQGGNVVAKKLSTNSFTMLLFRDILILSWQAPFVIQARESPFPAGSRGLLLLRGLSVGLLLAGHFYALRQLPLADVTMISSIRPVATTLVACLTLRESCGPLELLNLLLALAGILLVVQPAAIFGVAAGQYSKHMVYTALSLLAVNILGSGVRFGVTIFEMILVNR